MTNATNELNIYTQLRNEVEVKLKAGTAATRGQWSVGVDALRLLHRLSSEPEYAGDALKLLHELQVHQVELDLQHEEITNNEQTVAEDLDHYRTIFDSAPPAYCVLDLEGCVIRCNDAAVELLNVSDDDLKGQRIDTCVDPLSRPLVLDLIQRVVQRGVRSGCVAGAGDAQRSSRLQYQAKLTSDGGAVLLVCYECTKAQ